MSRLILFTRDFSVKFYGLLCLRDLHFEPGSDFDNAARMANLIKSPDGRGYFGFISGYNAYMEMISFHKLLDDARQRNRVFFQRLGIDRKPAEGASAPDLSEQSRQS